MPLGSFRLNTISALLSSAPSTRQTVTSTGLTASSTQSKFGGFSASAAPWNNSNKITSTLNLFPTSNYTVEFWLYLTTNTTYYTLLDINNGSSPMWIQKSDNTVHFVSNDGNSDKIITTTISTGVWHHFAVVNNAGTMSFYFDGTLQGTTWTISGTFGGTPWLSSSNILTIGCGYTGLDGISGYIDEFRISNSARYTANFTPSASAFLNDANTLLLLHCNSTPFTDDESVPLTSVSKIASKTQSSTSSANFVIPTTADVGFSDVAAGDVAVLFDLSTTTTDTTPSGWTSITKASTSGIRQNISYKILTSGDLGATITGMGGANRKVMIIFRGDNTPISGIVNTVIGSQATTAVPTNQSLTGEAGPMVAIAAYSATNITTLTRGWSVGSPAEIGISASFIGLYVKYLITNSGTPSTTTINQNDMGTNALQSFRIKFS